MKRVYQGLAITLGILFLLLVVTAHRQNARAQGGPPQPPPGHIQPIRTPSPATPPSSPTSKGEAPGTVHHITAADLPDPWNTKSSAVFSRPVERGDLWPKAPEGFKVDLYADSLKGDDGKPVSPRTIITAPNGDFCRSRSKPGRSSRLPHPAPTGNAANVGFCLQALASLRLGALPARSESQVSVRRRYGQDSAMPVHRSPT